MPCKVAAVISFLPFSCVLFLLFCEQYKNLSELMCTLTSDHGEPRYDKKESDSGLIQSINDHWIEKDRSG